MALPRLKSWAAWEIFLRRSLAKLKAPQISDIYKRECSFHDFRLDMNELERESQEPLKDKISHFAKTGRWIRLFPHERYLLGERILYALSVISVINTPCGPEKKSVLPVPSQIYPGEISSDHLWEWLLISIWECRGEVDWETSLRDQWDEVINSISEARKKVGEMVCRCIIHQSTDVITEGPFAGKKMFDSMIVLQNGECYSTCDIQSDAPTAEEITERFKTDRKRFSRRYGGIFKK